MLIHRSLIKPIALIAALLCATPELPAQKGHGLPVMRHFTPKEYNAEVRNWAMVQDKRGMMFIGNNAGVLKFDGNSWRLIPVNNTIVRSLAIDSNDRVYVGAQGEFGYLAPNEHGKLAYFSLLHLLDSADRNFTDVWTVHAQNDTIYFHTILKLFRITGSTVKTWNTSYAYHRSFIIDNRLYVRQDGIGLTRLEKDELRPVPGGHIFANEFISVMLPLAEKKILMGSRNKGLYVFDPLTSNPDLAIQNFQTEAEAFFGANSLYCGAVLHNGNFAIGTVTGGIAIITPQGKLVQIYDEAAGLQNNTAYYLFPERHNNLVVCSNGISVIENHSPISFWGKGNGLKGTVLSSVWHNGTLYAGTADGLFYFDSSERIFRKIEGVRIQCWRLLTYTANGKATLLAASTFGLFEIDGTKATPIDNGRSFSFTSHPENPELVFVGQNGTFLAIQKIRGKWMKKTIPVIVDNLFWSMAFDADENLWLGSEIHGLVKISAAYFREQLPELSHEIQPPYISRYDTANGLSTLSKTYIFNIHNKLCAATVDGVYAYDQGSDRFTAEDEIFKPLRSHGRVYQLAQDKNGTVWFESAGGKGALKKIDDEWVVEEAALKRMPPLPEYISTASAIYPDNDGIVWFGTAEGLFRFDPSYEKDYNTPFTVLLRSVAVNDSIRYWGYLPPQKQVLSSDENKLLFLYAAAFYEGGDYNQFSYQLEGFDPAWSEWTQKTEKEYTNLSPGKYTFKVKAKNVFGDESAPQTYSFTILAPWYLTSWMFIAYIFFGAASVYGIVKWRVYRLQNVQVRLQKIIDLHTQEIKTQNEELLSYQEEILTHRDNLEKQNTELEESRHIISLHNQELAVAVEERTMELALMNQELNNRYRQLEQFSFIAAHNLRAPAARILGLLSILDKASLGSANHEIVDKLVRAAHDLDTIILDLGAILNIQNGQTLNYELVELPAMLDALKRQFQDEIKTTNTQIELHASKTQINTIPVYLNSILTNLLSNSLKYRTLREIPRIRIHFDTGNGSYKLVVQDNGIGFDAEKFAGKLFEPFQRFHTHAEGKGLGMFLVKTQVNAMGGEIALQSKPNQGTRIEIVLPDKLSAAS